MCTLSTPNLEVNGHGTGPGARTCGSTSASSDRLQDANDESAVSNLTLDQSEGANGS